LHKSTTSLDLRSVQISLDVDFEEMLGNERCSKIQISNMERFLEKQGFHQLLKTTIAYITQNITSKCTFLFLENFSQAIYLDKYQIEDEENLSTSRHHPKIRMQEEMDLEKPAYNPEVRSTKILVFQNAYSG
jgi:hypothetical protein